ncbi:uncharacterized protein [Zea mays]|uniref:uncharacterized protein n=1 Tax=Zea mays TaxID=4577 RepID=UPI001652A659|nr:uncharacterized protein LOC118472103 [Zea mays]
MGAMSPLSRKCRARAHLSTPIHGAPNLQPELRRPPPWCTSPVAGILSLSHGAQAASSPTCVPFPRRRRRKLSSTQSSSRPDPIRPTPARPELLRSKSGHPRLAVEFLEQPHLAAILPSALACSTECHSVKQPWILPVSRPRRATYCSSSDALRCDALARSVHSPSICAAPARRRRNPRPPSMSRLVLCLCNAMLAGGQHMRLTDPARLLLFHLRFSR